MFISIVIPIWNDEKYLSACLDSCLAQDLSKDEYEIICVDDGSTDKTPEILREYAAAHSNVMLHFMQHQGGTKGRVTGMEHARGRYVWFVDHDDLVAPHAVDQLFAYERDHPGFARYRFPYYEFYDELTPEELALYTAGSLRSNSSDLRDNVVWSSIFQIDALRTNQISVLSSVIMDAGKFWGLDRILVMGSDAIFVQEFIDKGLSTADLCGNALYFYRRSESSVTMQNTKQAAVRRANGVYYSFLVTAYLASQRKEAYLAERQQSGQATSQTAIAAVVRIRGAVTQLAELPRKQWKAGWAKLNEKQILFDRVPDDYVYRFKDFWKSKPLRKKFKPSTIAFYYCFTTRGARWFRILNLPRLIGNRFSVLRQARKHQKELQLRKKGLSRSCNDATQS